MTSVSKCRILLVDDEKHWRDRVSAALGAAGFEVLTASDGSEAMARAATPRLGLMIVDEDLAGESGRMLTRFLRHNHPGVPAILYTNTEASADRSLETTRQDADSYLPKGRMAELLVRVGSCLR